MIETISKTELIYVLEDHWVQAVECNHEEKTDQVLCYCGWKSNAEESVGVAISEWAKHVVSKC